MQKHIGLCLSLIGVTTLAFSGCGPKPVKPMEIAADAGAKAVPEIRCE